MGVETVKQVWQTDDGQTFDTEKEAKRHDIDREFRRYLENHFNLSEYASGSIIDNPKVFADKFAEYLDELATLE